jgi:PIN domain nuclease of toxin-antitoxin system
MSRRTKGAELRVLLDTHVLVWWASDDPRLGSAGRDAIRTATDAYVSIVTAWEIAIKRAIGKLKMLPVTDDFLDAQGFNLVPVTLDHAAVSSYLPLHHRDPFDRMLVAQAYHEKLTLVTHDPRLFAYPIPIVRA